MEYGLCDSLFMHAHSLLESIQGMTRFHYFLFINSTNGNDMLLQTCTFCTQCITDNSLFSREPLKKPSLRMMLRHVHGQDQKIHQAMTITWKHRENQSPTFPENHRPPSTKVMGIDRPRCHIVLQRVKHNQLEALANSRLDLLSLRLSSKVSHPRRQNLALIKLHCPVTRQK